jgi:DNA-binding transcriptional MerR regulator
MSQSLWTLDALNEQVRNALAVGYVPASSARVRAVPDRRTIRYYTTLGLIDRAAEMRGRTAYYSVRHLHQLVAVKRLQAEGLTLSQVQQKLAGLGDDALAKLAKLPEPGLVPAPATDDDESPTSSRRSSFWEDAPAEIPAAVSSTETPSTQPFTGVPLADGISLLLAGGHDLEPSALLEILDAAGPLLRVLKSKGIIAE